MVALDNIAALLVGEGNIARRRTVATEFTSSINLCMTITEGNGEVVLAKGLIPVLAAADHTVEQEGQFAAGKGLFLKESTLCALDEGEDVLGLRAVVAPEVLHAVVISTADKAGIEAVAEFGS